MSVKPHGNRVPVDPYLVRIMVTEAEREFLTREVKGPSGGFQNLLREIQEGLDGYRLTLRRHVAERVAGYAAANHGEGGFQGRLRPIAVKVERTLSRLPEVQGRLFELETEVEEVVQRGLQDT